MFNVRADVMRPAYNFQPKYRVELLSRKDWTTGTGNLQISRGRSCPQMGPGWRGGPGLGSMGKIKVEGSVFL
jgi:hypothetical protein